MPVRNKPAEAAQVAGSESSRNFKQSSKNASEECAPTYGRAPEIIKEMIQSRRVTDKVPDPEDIAAGHPEDSPADKEHGRARKAQ